MTPSQKKLQAIEVEARARLHHPETIIPERDGDQPAATQLLVWEYPSFEPERSWGLLEVGQDTRRSLLLIHQVWYRTSDYERAHNPMLIPAFMKETTLSPTLAISFVEVDGALGRAWVEAVRGADLPALALGAPYGIDGTSYGFALDSPKVKADWWCDGPPEWASMIEVVSEARRAMSEELANRPMKADGRQGPAAAYR